MSQSDLSHIPVVVMAFANERTAGRYLRQLTVEMKNILGALEPAVQKGRVFIKLIPAATQKEIVSVFQDEWYHNRVSIFHYAGHADDDELWLESSDGGNESFFSQGLARFLGAQSSLRVVFLNGCATGAHASLLHEANVPAVITTAREIQDNQATEFATTFYRGLASGASLEESFAEAEGVLLGRYNEHTVEGTRGLFWESAPPSQTNEALPWRLTLRPKVDWVPAQWRLFYALEEESSGGRQAEEFVGEQVGNYELVKLLGQGTLGSVFQARHINLDEIRAIKVTHPVLQGYDRLKSLVLAGNKGLSTINHPNVVEFFDVGEANLLGEKRLYMVMELIEGERLDKMDYSTFWTTKEDLNRLIVLMLQLLSGLQAAHETTFRDASGMTRQGIIHGNIKTRKILFTPDGTPKLIDFLFSDLSRNSGIKFDYPVSVQEKFRKEDPEAFLAPEMIKGESGADVRTDLYALGAVFFEVITNTPANQMKFGTYETLQSYVRTHNREIPRHLIRVVWNLVHPKASLRYISAAEAIQDLEKGIPWLRRMLYRIQKPSDPTLRRILGYFTDP